MEEEVPKTILVVDDEIEIANLIEESVSHMGNYKILMAHSGTEALEIVKKSMPDLILLDIMMDDIEGTEVCRIIKADEKISHIPVFALTVIHRVDEARYNEIMESGIDEYVTKPFDFENLKALIEHYLK